MLTCKYNFHDLVDSYFEKRNAIGGKPVFATICEENLSEFKAEGDEGILNCCFKEYPDHIG